MAVVPLLAEAATVNGSTVPTTKPAWAAPANARPNTEAIIEV